MIDTERETWIARAKAVKIEDELKRHGIKLKKIARNEFAGPCPVCGGDDRFSINTAKQIFNCRGCSKGGDVIELAMFINGGDFNGAVEILAGEEGPARHRNSNSNGQAQAKPNGGASAKKNDDAKRDPNPAATYDYVDAGGELIFQVLRYLFHKSDGSLVLEANGKPRKTFRQRRPDPDEPELWIWGTTAGDYIRKGPRQDWFSASPENLARLSAAPERKTIAGVAPVPYRLPELIEAIGLGHTVLIVEGEAKADALANWKLTATCNAGGAGKWTAEHARYLRDANVVILPDADKVGREHAEAVACSLQGIAARIRVLELPGLGPKGDIIDWIAAGGSREQLDALVEQAGNWQPQEEGSTASRAEDDDPLARLLCENAIVLVGGNARIITWKKRRLYAGEGGEHEVPNLLAADSFRLFHRDKFQWTKGPDDKPVRRQLTNLFLDQARRYSDLVFVPGAGPEIGNQLNLWRGFGVAAKKGPWPLMRAHIRDIIAAGNEEQDSYLIRWMAWTAQNPGRQAEVALVLRGGKGTGKGTFGLAMCRIFGSHGLQIASRKHLVGGFNMHMSQCALLFADEAYWPGDKEGEGELKRLITEPTLTIEPKGLDLFTVANNLHVIIAGNEDWLIPASGDERRYAVTEVSSHRAGDRAYFDALYRELETSGLAAMLYDLKALDLAGWHPRNDVPQTDALQNQKAHTRRGVDALIETILNDAHLPCCAPDARDVALTTGEEKQEGLWHFAKATIPSLRHRHARTIMRELRENWGCTPYKNGSVRGCRFPPLQELRNIFGKKHGPQQWDNLDVHEW